MVPIAFEPEVEYALCFAVGLAGDVGSSLMRV
jgi:hypothetical protein